MNPTLKIEVKLIWSKCWKVKDSGLKVMHERNVCKWPLDLAYFCRRDSLNEHFKAPSWSPGEFPGFDLISPLKAPIFKLSRRPKCRKSGRNGLILPPFRFSFRQLNISPGLLRNPPPMFSFRNAKRKERSDSSVSFFHLLVATLLATPFQGSVLLLASGSDWTPPSLASRPIVALRAMRAFGPRLSSKVWLRQPGLRPLSTWLRQAPFREVSIPSASFFGLDVMMARISRPASWSPLSSHHHAGFACFF